MPREKKIPLRNLSIYLIKEDRKSPETILRSDAFSYHTAIKYGDWKIGDLFVKPPEPRLPKWAEIFQGHIDLSRIGDVATSSAVLLVQLESRFFAITFGQGRYLLQPNSWEEGFGLRVVLNSIGESSIKSIDKRTFDAITKQSREQASREVGAQDFGLDVEQDLLRAVTGRPTDTQLGQRMSGMDALKVAVYLEIEMLPELLKMYYAKFHDSSYKEKFPWVGQLSEIKDRELLDQLNDALVEIISRREFDRCWLAAPDIIDWDQVNGFRYGTSKHYPIHHDIHFPEFLDSLPKMGKIHKDRLTSRHIYCVGEDGTILYKWPVYKCICCELDHGGDSYLLSGGKWYRVARDFVNEINQFYDQVPRFNEDLPEFNHESEGKYNEYVSTTWPETFALMDKKTIQYGGGYNKIEACDLFSKSGSFIHVKRYGGSSSLSHLFAQGLVSGELFQTDADFREKVNGLLPDTHKLVNITTHPTPGQYQVVFAIISDSEGDDLELPFFSRLNLRHAVRRLKGYGYKVSLAKIRVSKKLKVLKRYL